MGTKAIYVFAKWQVKENQLATVLDLLNEVAEKSRKESGNLYYKVYQSDSETNMLLLSESYLNEAALEKHRNSNHFKNIVIHQIVPLLENREVHLTNEII